MYLSHHASVTIRLSKTGQYEAREMRIRIELREDTTQSRQQTTLNFDFFIPKVFELLRDYFDSCFDNGCRHKFMHPAY